MLNRRSSRILLANCGAIAIGLLLVPIHQSDARGRGGFRGGGGGGVSRGGGGISRGGFSGGGVNRSPSMSRPSPSINRPSPSINRPSVGTGGRNPGLSPRPTTPSRPSIPSRPSTGLPSNPGNSLRPGTGLPSRPSVPSSRPSQGQLNDFLNLDRPSQRPSNGGGAAYDFLQNRPSTRPAPFPSFGDRPSTQPVERPGVGDRPSTRPGQFPSFGDRPSTQPAERPGIGDRPSTRPGQLPGIGERPSTRPADRPGIGDRPTTLPAERPNRPGVGDRPNWPVVDRPIQRPRPPGWIPPGQRPPGYRPPGYRPPRPIHLPHYSRAYWGRYHWRWGWNRYPHNWWRWATVGGITTWFVAWNPQPIYYSYGDTIYYEGDSVVYNNEVICSASEYADQAQAIAEAVPSVDPEDVQWMPLGVFALSQQQGSVEDATLYLQLAISKEGIIAGTFQNTATGKSIEVEGTIEQKSQRAAWGPVSEDWPIMETGIFNLTENEASALLHFENGQTQQWSLVRLDEPTEQ